METHEDDWLHFVPDIPIPISLIGGRYLLFDVKAVSYLRRDHKLCGYNIGTLPQSPSQNVFLGLPTLIMPEEAQLLIEQGLGYLLDDARAHDQAVHNQNKDRKVEFLAKVQRQADEVEKLRGEEQEAAKQRALTRRSNSAQAKDESKDTARSGNLLNFDGGDDSVSPISSNPTRSNSTIQDTPITRLSNPASAATYFVTPTSSNPLLDPTLHDRTTKIVPCLPTTYPLFRHLHNQGYFMTPGLRFGCQYAAYPGDPLRFHSHFLAVGVEWEQEIDLMEIVGGGRLGTGVKKGFLIGGEEKGTYAGDRAATNYATAEGGETEEKNRVRTFSIEWAVM